jgi:hypothetical protein
MSVKKRHIPITLKYVILCFWVTLMPICRLQGQISRVDSLTQLSPPKQPDKTLTSLRKEKSISIKPFLLNKCRGVVGFG